MLKPSLQLKLGQQLTMTPQLQQAIRLLQLPAIELQAHISELLESNVMLEPTDDEAAPEFEPLPTDAIAQGGPAEDSSPVFSPEHAAWAVRACCCGPEATCAADTPAWRPPCAC
jgi:RNA polymerase sigma-54 factor